MTTVGRLNRLGTHAHQARALGQIMKDALCVELQPSAERRLDLGRKASPVAVAPVEDHRQVTPANVGPNEDSILSMRESFTSARIGSLRLVESTPDFSVPRQRANSSLDNSAVSRAPFCAGVEGKPAITLQRRCSMVVRR
jgi:hypothetical protein